MVSRRVQVARPERNSRNIAYNVWKKMRDRCNNPNSDHYKWYGAKGITVCERWDSFDNFISDMGKRPSLKHSIDRIDNALGYEPGNCRWATQAEQNRNRAANTYITHNGKTQCMAAWAEELVVNKTTVAKRIKRGWENSDAVTILSMSTRNSHASRNHHKGVKHGSHETPRRGGDPRSNRRPPGATCRGGNSGAQCGPGDDEVAPAQAPFLAT